MNIRYPIAVLTLSAAGFVGMLISEGYSDKAVIPIPGDVPTIGFGTTAGVKLGDKTTPVAAAQRALKDVSSYEGTLKKCVNSHLTQAEYDLYVDMSYNIGPDNFCRSTIVRKINEYKYREACDAILMWKYAAGKNCSLPESRCMGLWDRRKESHRKCLSAQG